MTATLLLCVANDFSKKFLSTSGTTKTAQMSKIALLRENRAATQGPFSSAPSPALSLHIPIRATVPNNAVSPFTYTGPIIAAFAAMVVTFLVHKKLQSQEFVLASTTSSQEEVKEFLIDGQPVYDDKGERITSKQAYKKFQKSKQQKTDRARQNKGEAGPASKPKKAKPSSQYADTVLLPQTSFELRANSTVKEPEIQAFWASQGTYAQLLASSTDRFTLHDGPPYANGSLHMGHALNKILKDIVNKYNMMQGRKVEFIPGWDTHGLPIELKVLQSLTPEAKAALQPLELRRMARDFALETVEAQKAAFQRYGVWGSFGEPYVTLAPEYEAAQIEMFGQMVAGGHIYRGRKPVYWSPSSQTALAEAELEYPEGHVSPSIYVGMEVEQPSPVLQGSHGAVQLAIWTTTPWTIPANRAVSVNPELSYSLVGRPGGAPALVIATDLLEELKGKFGQELTILKSFPGKDLEGTIYRHPLTGRLQPVVMGGDYITTAAGTGLVHTAPGHGMDDYVTGQKYGLEVFAPVDDAGRFTAEAGEGLAGLEVMGDGNKVVQERLQAQGQLLLAEPYDHKYPYDWRTKKPCIMRATLQWFCSVDRFRDKALEAIAAVEWIPPSGETRIRNMVEQRSDWCISRQRTWGVPIPVFYDKGTGQELLDPVVIAHVAAIFRERGTDAWWELSAEELLPPAVVATGKEYVKGMDTMDVWFDSGSSWASVIKQRGIPLPVDLYLEGSDQSRGWFQSSLITSVAANNGAPYKTVLTHGFVLDERGFKMSKSLGNVVDPTMIINGGADQAKDPAYGADTLRLWVASVNYSADVLIGSSVLAQISGSYRKIRGTLRFLIGNLFDFDPNVDAVPWKDLPALDQYFLTRTEAVFRNAEEAYSQYQFGRVVSELLTFCVKDLSSFYLDVAKDRLYISGAGEFRRRSCQTVLDRVVQGLVRLLAPVLCHTAEDAWQALRGEGDPPSVFQAGRVPDAPQGLAVDEHRWTQILELCSQVDLTLEQARSAQLIASALEAKVHLRVSDPALKAFLGEMNAATNDVDNLKYLFIVSQVELADEAVDTDYRTQSDLGNVFVTRADGHKCGRCWNYCPSLGEIPDHPELCRRCARVLALA